MAFALVAADVAVAQEVDAAVDTIVVEEIVVTATKRSDTILEIPQSIQAFSDETLERLGVSSLRDVINKISGVTGFATGTGTANFNIRGVQSISGSVIDSSTIGYYLDETPLANASITPDVTLYDLERVEVLKGPQGTLYGEGSLGGTIRLVSKKPSFEAFEGEVFGDVATTRGGGETYRASAVLNLPLADTAALRVVGSFLDQDGFIDDALGGTLNINDSEITNVRATLRFEPAPNFEALVSYIRQDASGGPEPFQAPGEDLALLQSFDQAFDDAFDIGSVTLRWDVGAAELVYAGSYYDRERSALRDERSSLQLIEDFFGLTLPQGLEERTISPEKTWTHELRAASTGDGAFAWIVGAFHKNREVGLASTSFVPDFAEALPDIAQVFSIDVATRFKETAGFGEVSYRLADALKLTGGLRVFRQTYRGTTQTTLVDVDPETGLPFINGTGLQPVNQETEEVLFKASIDYKPNDNSLIYALFSQGVRGGGVNTRLFTPDVPRTFDPDSVDNYELGVKLRALDNRLSLNASIYQIDWQDIQVPIVLEEGIDFISNAGGSRTRGGEFDFDVRAADWLSIGGSYSYIDAKLTTPLAVSPPGGDEELVVLSGSRIPLVARDKFSVFADINVPIGGASGFARIDVDHVGKRTNSLPVTSNGLLAVPALVLPSYTLVGLRAGVEGERISVTAYVDNLFDELALLQSSTPDVEGFLVNRPRTVGINARFRF